MATKRELIEPTPGDKRYIRRDDQGRIDETVDVGTMGRRKIAIKQANGHSYESVELAIRFIASGKLARYIVVALAARQLF